MRARGKRGASFFQMALDIGGILRHLFAARRGGGRLALDVRGCASSAIVRGRFGGWSRQRNAPLEGEAFSVMVTTERSQRRAVDVAPTFDQGTKKMTDLSLPCSCASVPSRLSQALAPDLDVPFFCATHGAERQIDPHVLADFEALQEQLLARSANEPGSFLWGFPVRWFTVPVRLRCASGHVTCSGDMASIVCSQCPECGLPVALTYPEDERGPLRSARP